MQLNSAAIAGSAVIWLGTLVGAFYLGNRHDAGIDGKAASGAGYAGGTTGENSVNRGSTDARGSRTREALAKPLTVKQILAKLKTSMRGGAMQNPSAMMKVMGLLDKIQPEDVQEALAEAESITDPQQKMLLSMCLLAKWAELDGPAAMKYAEDHSAGSGPMGQMAKMSVAGAWAEKDPEAVWKWYKDQADKDTGGMFGSNMALVSLFSNMAEKDLDLAFKRLEEIDGSGKQMALAGMFQSALFDDAKLHQILAKVDSLPDTAERKQTKQMMLGQWAMMAPEQAVAWVKTQPQDEQQALREGMGTMLMMTDPKKGANLLLDGVSEQDKPQSYAQIVSQWAAMDTTAAGNWLKEQPQSPQLDAARQAFVNVSSQKDPQTAMEWAVTITNPDLRVSATTVAYQAWKGKDAAAADQALGNSGLDAAQIQAVKDGQAGPGGTREQPEPTR